MLSIRVPFEQDLQHETENEIFDVRIYQLAVTKNMKTMIKKTKFMVLRLRDLVPGPNLLPVSILMSTLVLFLFIAASSSSSSLSQTSSSPTTTVVVNAFIAGSSFATHQPPTKTKTSASILLLSSSDASSAFHHHPKVASVLLHSSSSSVSSPSSSMGSSDDERTTDTLVDRLLLEIQQVQTPAHEEEEGGETIQTPLDVVSPVNHTVIIEDLISRLSTIQQQQQPQPPQQQDTESNDATSNKFEPLIGYYNVTYTLTVDPNENPVGGKWTRGRPGSKVDTVSKTTKIRRFLPRPPSLWTVQRTLQHVLPPISPVVDNVAPTTMNSTSGSRSSSPSIVAQVVNAILLECFGGWMKIWVVLRGDAVPINTTVQSTSSSSENDENLNDTNNNNMKKSKGGKKQKKLLPGLTDRTVKVFFDKPRIGIQINKRRNRNHCHFRQVISLGPTSSVVIDTPYVDSKVRVGVGGTSGTKFVFRRIEESKEVNTSSSSNSNDYDAIEGWKWVLDDPQKSRQSSSSASPVLTKQKMMVRVGAWSLISAVCFKLIRGAISTNTSIVVNQGMIMFLRTFGARSMKWITGVSTVASFISFVWLLFSTGGIEDNSTTKEDNINNIKVGGNL